MTWVAPSRGGGPLSSQKRMMENSGESGREPVSRNGSLGTLVVTSPSPNMRACVCGGGGREQV